MKKEVEKKIVEILDGMWSLDKDSYGEYEFGIEADYRDEFDKQTAIKILRSELPEEMFWDSLDYAYSDAVSYYETDVFDEVKRKLTEDGGIFPEGLDAEEEEEVDWFLRENVHFRLPENHYLEQEFPVPIMVDTGDGNYDFTLNAVYPFYDGRAEDKIHDKASIVWLARQQGYTKTQLRKSLLEGDIRDPEGFLETMRQEVANLPSHMGVLIFLVKMRLRDLMELNRLIKMQNRNGVKYDSTKNPYCGYIVIGKEAETGLFDPWSGGGSVLEVKLEKDVRLPIRFIRSALPDGGDGYSLDSVYGLCGSVWRDCVKKIHAPSNKILEKEKKVC